MNSLRVSGFTPGFGNNHDFSVFINQNKIHRVLFSSARYFADVCAAFWGKRFRCLISSLETHCWTVQQSGFRIHHRERHFPHPSNLWSEAISTLPKRCHKKIQETDLEASWHWWYYIILHLLSLLTKLSERNFHQFYDSRSSTFHLFQWYSSLFIHFIHLRPWTEMESGLPSPMNRRSAANAARTQKRSETESLEFCKIPGVPKSVEICWLMSWTFENYVQYVQKGKNDVLKERCVFLFPRFFGPEIWQFNSEHMALYADERWTWLSHQQIVDFDWTVNSF